MLFWIRIKQDTVGLSFVTGELGTAINSVSINQNNETATHNLHIAVLGLCL